MISEHAIAGINFEEEKNTGKTSVDAIDSIESYEHTQYNIHKHNCGSSPQAKVFPSIYLSSRTRTSQRSALPQWQLK